MLRVSMPAPLFTTPPAPLICPVQIELRPLPMLAPTLPLPEIMLLPAYSIPVRAKLLLIVELFCGVRFASPPGAVLFVEINPVGNAPDV